MPSIHMLSHNFVLLTFRILAVLLFLTSAIQPRIHYNFVFVVSRHRTLMNIFDKAPVVDKDAFVAPSASIIGDVQVGRGSSIWYGCVLRGKILYV